ncbi:MAG: hypothetical protein A3F95_01805 [Candidatus Nealsonbacteria bacterium RIFCSPLOWO2_12_FULL_39_31]|uniref:Uncharacterized protein n=3 Tax=Candidatus Nealsoniibacteriota TaxID=1817911 RepID=A0A1G2EJM4_9BACT|nr:MAG: hypothetical protein A2626_01710 [Candidatus Nealsonbacteria bacterium RIFCSPHIGHO2_01_FULL_38_55]OGZ20637.1 MAG: hypothetical protein A2W55_01520 [Candidatus Nealsonbacteria bacterium RIFCSPHIGHO2_02_38_10]OGZ22889.1 MAG: hypothetical protein A2981_00215 [Candidatus Nealsonbacteria bacterium RIFCSPLOWO2_01_FULL_38_120]OGZ23410.1 MAG: hypothetical protein A3E18_00255 [Candidatus Nealsonbacteria bacterium RIFCSPHIGHO2_12_FULL_38_18]OGZ25561.1 MAG: hypothetical protein A2W71_00610 [Candid
MVPFLNFRAKICYNYEAYAKHTLNNCSKFAAEIWRKAQETLFLFGILQFKFYRAIFLSYKTEKNCQCSFPQALILC